MKGLVILAVLGSAHANWNETGDSSCDYVSSNVKYVDVDKILTSGAVYVGKAPLPERTHGMFWLVDDGGDALVSFGGPPGGVGTGECSSGKLTQEGGEDDKTSYCTTISTVRPGGWTFQAFGTPPGVSGGKFPTNADSFYEMCGSKWKFCFDSNQDPTSATAVPEKSRSWCVNVMAASTTTAEYKGTKHGGHYWRVTTKALGIIPLPSWVPGNFDMIQVVDGDGNKVQPGWDMFAAANKQIVVYTGANELIEADVLEASSTDPTIV